MADLPPEDQPDTISIGPVGPIPLHYDDDPRLAEDRAAWSAATAKAQSLHSADELLAGLRDADWRVRHDVVDRLIARARDDARTVPALLRTAKNDPAWQVRDAVVMRLGEFDRRAVAPTLQRATNDPQPEVQWAARHALGQLGEPDS